MEQPLINSNIVINNINQTKPSFQGDFQNQSAQNSLIPLQSNTTSFQWDSQTNYPPSNEGVIFQTKPIINNEIKKEIPHKGILQPDENSFYITTGCCFKFIPFFGCFLGLLMIVISLLTEVIIIVIILGSLIFLVNFSFFFVLFNNVYFIMGQNNLKIVKEALCRKKTLIYNPGQLLRIELNYQLSSDDDASHKYELIIYPMYDDKDTIFSIGSSSKVFTNEEIDYFLKVINNHIQTKMRI